MWFGTIDGLHSFDGYEIKEWRDDSLASLGSVISTIIEDKEHRLWIGSGSGVAIYDLRKERFMEVPVDPASGVRIKSPVTDIVSDRKGNIWLASSGEGVFRYDPSSKIMRQYPAVAKIPHDLARTIFEDSSGTIWVGTQEGLCRYNPSQDRFVAVGGKDGAMIDITTLFEDGYNNLWVGSRGQGLFLYDKKSNRLVPKLISDSEHSVFLVRSIVEWERGKLLLASDQGLTCYDIGTGESVVVTADDRSDHHLNDNYLQSLFVDRERGLWIGTYFGGVNYVSPEKKMFTNYNRNNSSLGAKVVSMFANADDGNLWIGSDDAGIFYWDRKSNHIQAFNNHPLLRGSAHKNIHALLQDGDQLFVGMYLGGLNVIDLKTGSVRNFTSGDSSNSLYSSSIYSIYRDSYGDIWIGTSMGLNKFRKETGDFERIFETYPADICFILDDKKGYMWACSTNNGVFRLERTTGKWQHFQNNESPTSLPLKSIVTAACDDSGNLWLGTDGAGLLRFDYETGDFIHEKLPRRVRVINKIIAHKDGLWLGTTKGLMYYDPESGAMHAYDKDSGLQDNVFLPNSGIMTPDGHIMMGGINGFNEFDPDRTEPNYTNPEVILSDFQIFNRPVAVGDDGSSFKETITYSDGITLDDNQRVFSFKVSPISYVNPSQNRYLYKLEGFDKDWNEATPPFPHTYTNLPAGDYVFNVRTADGNGGWNDVVFSFPIKVLPPWWMSVPMIILYVAVLIVVAGFIYKRIIRKQKERLQRLADQKDREMYHSKIEFFTCIVHEIRTPLTLIVSPLDNLIKSTWSVEDCRRQLVVMQRNAKRLLSLVNHLMDFRKIESGSIKLNPQLLDLREPLNSICQNYILTAAVRQIKVEVEIEDSPCLSEVDREAFRQIVDNLLSNALKFSRSEIDISLGHVEEGRRIMLRVKDNGPGIAEKEQEKIFTPFYQIAENKPTDYIGTGLGLLLVKRYASLMDASVELHSEIGKGSEFRVLFNSVEEGTACSTGEMENTGMEPVCETVTEAADDSRRKVLIVDDNADMLRFMSDLLSPVYDVLTASCADEALKVIARVEPSLIVSDVMMPGIDGMEFCRMIKSDIRTSHIPVILLTAKVGDSDFVTGFDSGADLYATKPFSPEVLLSQIRSLLANRDILRNQLKENPTIIANLVPNDSPDKEFFTKIRQIVEERLSDPEFSVDVLAREAAISRTGLFTKLKAVAEITPNEYIKQVRLQKAAELLSNNKMRVSEVCWQVGFSSRSHFAKCFQTQFGVPPSEYKG